MGKSAELTELTAQIAKILQETDLEAVKTIRKIIQVAGEEKTAKFVKKAAELYKSGLRTEDNTRRRTLGGCFFYVARGQLSTKKRRQAGLYFKSELKSKNFTNSNSEILMARSLRLAVVQNQYDQGNLTEAEARELLSRPLTPGDEISIFDDSDQLRIKLKICKDGHQNCEFGAASLSHHDWHCPKCDHHLTSLYACPECGVRYNPPNKAHAADPLS